MGWIHYKKVFDYLPDSWIQKCLEVFGICANIQNFVNKVLKTIENNFDSKFKKNWKYKEK